jgi:quinol-cytochrome oxidoreductase complex cytochrome b subunit
MNDSNLNNQQESQEQSKKKIILKDSQGSIEINKRIAILPKRVPDKFLKGKKRLNLIPTFPNLIIREVICFQLVFIVVILISIFFDAPLEHQANPNNTPNPAKAPWYFLGLQELLHYFPPVVAGVLIPGLVIIALIILPYYKINVKREGLWKQNKQKKIIILAFSVLIISGVSLFFHAYSIAIPTILIFSLTLLPYFLSEKPGWINWLKRRSIADWIMTWFVVLVVVLTIIGTFFRGEEWSWIWPW